MQEITVEEMRAYDIPVPENDWGNEEFVDVTDITYLPEMERLVVDYDDADEPQGFGQVTFKTDGWVNGMVQVVDNSAVGVPALNVARTLDHLTMVEMLVDSPHIVIVEVGQ